MKKKIFSILAAICCSVGLMAQDTPDYFSMTATEANVTVKLVKVSSPTVSVTIQYSTDKSVWTNITLNETEITVAPGTPVYFKNGGTKANSLCTADATNLSHLHFTMSGTGKIALGGKICSLLDGTVPTNQAFNACAFYGLFENCTNLVSVESTLLNTTAKGGHYFLACMFKGCSNLTNAPKLPGTQSGQYAFQSMFEGCTSLTTVPVDMLENSTSSAPKFGCQRMFYGCSKLTNAPTLKFIGMSQSTCESMFEGCEKLEVAPDLNQSDAATLQADCYKRMFYGCTSLQSIKVRFTQWTTSNGAAFTTEWLPDNTGAEFLGPKSLIEATSERTSSTVPSNWTMEIAPTEIKANATNNTTTLGNLIGQGAQKILLLARPIKANMWNTICLPFDMTAAQVAEVFGEGTLIGSLTRGETQGDELFLDFETDVTAIEAGVPYIIKPSVTEDIEQPLFKDVTVTTSTVTGNYTVGDVTFYGTFAAATSGFENCYGLGQDQMIHPMTSNLFGFRAYFRWSKPGAQAPKRVHMSIHDTETTTADEQLRMNEAVSTKMMVNGQLVIMRDGIRYNAQGQVIQ